MNYTAIFEPPLPRDVHHDCRWGRLYGSSAALAVATACRAYDGLTVLLTSDMRSSERLENELRFYLRDGHSELLVFPD
ncbi:MAG: hypothetical protein ACE5ET_09025, partial [Gammaproteobacteria bacterium]